MIEINIVSMTQQHVSAVAKMESLCFSDPWSERSVGEELQNPLSLWLVALCGETVVGYIGSQTAVDESDMMNLAVLPEYRREKIGSRLVQELICRLRQQGSLALFLEVRQSNHSAIMLYEKLGFVTAGVRPNYYFHPRENAIIMRKELNRHENSCS